MRVIDADKVDFNEIFGGQSEFANDMREAAKRLMDKQPTCIEGTVEKSDVIYKCITRVKPIRHDYGDN